ncbi:MAG: DUF167 domain-containing protein [Vampirovibrionales bacterium]
MSTPSTDCHSVPIHVWAKPGSKQTRIVGWRPSATHPHTHTWELHVAVAAPACDGQANEALIEALAHWLTLPTRHITLVAGHTQRRKRVHIVLPQNSAQAQQVQRQLTPPP